MKNKKVHPFCHKAFQFIRREGKKLLFQRITAKTRHGAKIPLKIPSDLGKILKPKDTIWVEKGPSPSKLSFKLVC